MAHITLSQLTTVLQRIVSWATGKFAAKNTYSGKLEYADMPVVVLASMGSELDGTSTQRTMSAGFTYYLPAEQGAGARIMFVDSNGTAVKISDPVSNVIYCNAYTGLLYRWDESESDMVPVGGDVDGLRKVYVGNNDFSSLDTLYSGVYQVIEQSTQRVIGVLAASSDNKFGANPYFVTQWLFSNLMLSDEYSGSLNNFYTTGRAHIIQRFYNASNSYIDIPLNTWSEWKVYGLTLDEMSGLLNSKVSSISVNGGTAQTPDGNGNVNIQVQTGSTISPATAAPSMDGTANVGSSAKYAREDHVHPHDTTKLSKSDVSVETQGDGTVDINVKDDTYTINLNHTHEGMAKLVVDTAANLPDASEMESDTIYGELDDGEIATIYLGGYPFYGGGGGASSGPVLRRPADGATIDMGQTTSGTVSKTINVKGKSLTQALTIELDGTGYTFGTTQPSGVTRDSATQLTVTAAAANALNGVDIVVVYTGNDTDEDASGTLGITSNDNISTEATLVANKVTYEDLAGVKLTGTQWLQTDYHPNANTEFSLSCRFEQRSDTQSTSKDLFEGYILGCKPSTSGKYFSLRNLNATSDNAYNPWNIGFANETSIQYGSDYQIIPIGNNESTRPYLLVDPVQVYYRKGTSNGTLGFTDGTHTLTKPTSLKSSTEENAMMIGRHETNDKAMTYSIWDLTIYSLVITENGTEVHHWVPKMKNGAIPGLYDTVTGKFISSETSTELVAVN